MPKRDINHLSDKSKIKRAWTVNHSMFTHEPKSTNEATQQTVRILDTKYEKADLQSVVSDCKHLSQSDQKKLLELLQQFEELFDGTLGDWRTEPVSFELKPGATPFRGRAFPVPKLHKKNSH